MKGGESDILFQELGVDDGGDVEERVSHAENNAFGRHCNRIKRDGKRRVSECGNEWMMTNAALLYVVLT